MFLVSLSHIERGKRDTSAHTVRAQLQYGGIVVVAPLWLLFALDYHGTATPIGPAQRYVLLAPALVSYAAVLSNGAHHLWWPTVALDLSRPFGSLQITRGLLFWLHLAYSYGCIGLGFVVILHRMRITAPFQRRQAQLVALGALCAQFPDGVVVLVYGQRERLSQVLTNLLSNAIKFTDQGAITVRTVHEGQRVRFSVTDTGVGIAPEQQQAIFEEFEQLVNAHQDYSPGTGLGLSISRRLMELMDGALTVESTPGVGSTFSGSLLIAQEPLQTKAYGAPL